MAQGTTPPTPPPASTPVATPASPATPPPAALKTGVSRGLFVATVVIVAAVMLGAGFAIGYYLYRPASSSAHQYLVVGTNIPFPPFEDFNTTTGNYVGFDIDFAMMIATATHRTLVIDNYADFSALLLDTGKGAVDMAASGITSSGSIGAARNATLTFSNPYFAANQGVITQSSSSLTCASNVCTASDLQSLQVGVQTGTSSEDWANANLPTGNIHHFTTVDVETAALQAGSIDAMIIDTGPAKAISGASGGAIVEKGIIVTGEQYSFAVALHDPQGLIPIINSVISQAQQNGTYQQLITKWGLG